MENQVLEQPKQLADAETFAEHKALRERKADPPPAKEQPKTGDSSVPPASEKTATGSESAGVSETPPQEQEKPEGGQQGKGKQRNLDNRIGELTKARDTEKARADRLEEELRQLRTRKPDEQPAPKTSEPKPADELKRPIRSEYRKDPKYETFEAADDAYDADLDAYYTKKAKTEAEQATREKSQNTVRETIQKRLQDGRAKCGADFDEVVKSVGIGTDQNGLAQFFQEFEKAGEVLYYLGTHPEEHQEILALPALPRVAALWEIQRKLSASPEPKKTPVSRVPPPPARLPGGTEIAASKSLSEATSMAEYKRLRAQGAR